MFTSLVGWLKETIAKQSIQTELDSFISSKKPTSPSEVEYWIRYYDQHQKIGM